MKVISKQNNYAQNKNTTNHGSKQNHTATFKGGEGFISAVGKGFQFLDANPMAGVTFLDVSTAIGPNTIIDAKERNPIQAFETFRRESSGLLINCLLPGVAAAWVGRAIKKRAIGSEFKELNAHQIWADKMTIDDATHSWKELSGGSKEEKIEKFVEKSFKKLVVNEKSTVKDLSDTARSEKLQPTIKKLSKAMIDAEDNKLKIPSKILNEVHDELAAVYGDSKSIKVKSAVSGEQFGTNLKNYVRNTYSLGKAFTHKSIKESNIDKFSKNLKNMIGRKSIATMAGIGVLALAMQKINRKITEKVSGKKGYQGYAGGNTNYVAPSKEDKTKLLAGKALAVGWMASLALGAMGRPTAGMLNFTSPSTSINQARTFALLTNTGRIGAAEDKNELKDTALRDTMIFLNLYVLGDYVTKGVVTLAEKIHKKKHGVNLNLMNEGKKLDKNASTFKKFDNWLRHKSVKSFQEIEGTVSKAGTKTRKNIITMANVSGIAYSLVALGVIMPIAIARMTQKNRKKQLEQMKINNTNHSNNVSMSGGFSNEKTQKLFKAFKS